MLGQEDSVLLEEKEGAAPAEVPSIESEGVPKPSESSVQGDSKESQPEIDDCELKQDDSEKPMDQKDFPGDDVEKTLTEDDEIPAKIARIDNEVAKPTKSEATFKSEEPVSENNDTGDEPINDANVKSEEPVSENNDTGDEPINDANVKSEEPVSENNDTGDEPINDANVKSEEESPDMDKLSDLASALNPKYPDNSDLDTPQKKVEPWCNVGVFDSNTTIVTDYMALPEMNEDIDLASATFNGRHIPLEAGAAYKFRVCAVNSCGRSAWSDVSAFKTTLPGFPGVPYGIKIVKLRDGAHLTWNPPEGASGDILEYEVYLSVRPFGQAIKRVYCGPTNKCVVGFNLLKGAHLDVTTKPAIIFRIVAKNTKGYGPPTQVRWLLE